MVVLGAGIAGLSCAVALGEAGLRRVAVLADSTPADTVSAMAGGLWFPYGVEDSERSLTRIRASYGRLEALVGVPEAAVEMVDHLHVSEEDPWWAAAMPAGRVRPVPGGFLARVPLVRSPVHLEYLTARAVALGATFARRRVGSLEELLELAPVAVNCAGLGARELCGDDGVTAVRGQVVHLRADPARDAGVPSVADADGPDPPTYVLPRGDLIVAGGTAEAVDGEEAGAAPDPAIRKAILARCETLVPALAGAEVIGERVGLRPVRAGGPRVEAEAVAGGTVIHDYGHGGAGWTLAWGCALEVVAAVRALGLVP